MKRGEKEELGGATLWICGWRSRTSFAICLYFILISPTTTPRDNLVYARTATCMLLGGTQLFVLVFILWLVALTVVLFLSHGSTNYGDIRCGKSTTI